MPDHAVTDQTAVDELTDEATVETMALALVRIVTRDSEAILADRRQGLQDQYRAQARQLFAIARASLVPGQPCDVPGHPAFATVTTRPQLCPWCRIDWLLEDRDADVRAQAAARGPALNIAGVQAQLDELEQTLRRTNQAGPDGPIAGQPGS